jgi:hypothetical protein
MKRIGLMIGFLALLIVVLPSFTAQDAKKDAAKTEQKDEAKKDDAKKDEPKKDEAKKDEPKKDDAKKDEKKDPEKKDDEKKKAEPKKSEKEKINSGLVLTGVKIISANGENSRDFTIEVQEIDPKKVYDMNVWKAQQMNSLAQQQFNMQKISPKDVQGRINAQVNYNKALAQYQFDLAKRNIYSPKNVEVKAAENAKVRIMYLPPEFDDAGAVKKFTKKEIEERKDKTGLPGFPADFDAIKSGQYIDIYLAKQAPAAKVQPKKKGPDDEDVPVAQPRQEYVMIVIKSEPPQQK